MSLTILVQTQLKTINYLSIVCWMFINFLNKQFECLLDAVDHILVVFIHVKKPAHLEGTPESLNIQATFRTANKKSKNVALIL